jgi:hypothetical protein
MSIALRLRQWMIGFSGLACGMAAAALFLR